MAPGLSVIIPTRDRASSLRETLRCLAVADRAGTDVEVVVVDNGSADDTQAVVKEFRDRLPLRCLYEPTHGVYGKSHALNCAIQTGGLGDVIAVLDDDMSPERGWFRGVMSLCARWPDHDLFSGRCHIIWPNQSIPVWAQAPRISGWAFSVQDYGLRDVALRSGYWFLGGHFWFRSRVLPSGRRFADCWLTEPRFMLDLIEDGCQGVCGPDAVAGHRVQPHLLDEQVLLRRAREAGCGFANVRLVPHRNSVRHARLLARHPVAGRVYCLAQAGRWAVARAWARRALSGPAGFASSLVAVERLHYHLEALRVARQTPDYRLPFDLPF